MKHFQTFFGIIFKISVDVEDIAEENIPRNVGENVEEISLKTVSSNRASDLGTTKTSEKTLAKSDSVVNGSNFSSNSRETPDPGAPNQSEKQSSKLDPVINGSNFNSHESNSIDAKSMTSKNRALNQHPIDFKLKVVNVAKKSSNREAARLHSVDESMVRRWRKNEEKLMKTLEKEKVLQAPKSSKEVTIKPKRFRASGAGRKVTDDGLEDILYQWILDRRDEFKHVSRKGIQEKALSLSKEIGNGKPFNASRGWCCSFLKRFNLSTRQKTHQSQRLPTELVPKVVRFFRFLREYLAKNPQISEDQMVAMDETCVFLENVSNKTITKSGKFIKLKSIVLYFLISKSLLGEKTVSLLTTGHEKANITVILAASASGKKKRPFVILKGKGQAKDMKELKKRRDIDVGFSSNGWANDEIIEQWINCNFGSVFFQKRLLIWDSFRAHISDGTKKVLKQKRIDQALIPGGCTGLFQAPDVVWNKPFKVRRKVHSSQLAS